jgi:hypothetical protein
VRVFEECWWGVGEIVFLQQSRETVQAVAAHLTRDSFVAPRVPGLSAGAHVSYAPSSNTSLPLCTRCSTISASPSMASPFLAQVSLPPATKSQCSMHQQGQQSPGYQMGCKAARMQSPGMHT